MKAFYSDSVIPDRAGLAKLHYDKNIKEPKRVKEDIVIPQNGFSLYQLSAGFEQFLAIKDKPEEHDSRYTKPYKAWFGGTDELPFLVRLKDDPGNGDDWISAWQKNSIYNLITPLKVLYAKKMGLRTKRQGDIFAVEHPIQDAGLACMTFTSSHLFSDVKTKITLNNISRGEGFGLFGTRHKLVSGEYMEGRNYFSNSPERDIILRGRIEAPDHEPLDLDKLNIVWQTRNLYEPQKAD